MQKVEPFPMKLEKSSEFSHETDVSTLSIAQELFQDGKPRLYRARALLFGDGQEADLKTVKGFYLMWVNLLEFILFMKLVNFEKQGFYAVPCSKRGNEIYYRRNRARFRHLWKNLEKLGGSVFDPHGNLKKTRLVFVTLTWATQGRSLRESWENGKQGVSADYNRWITALRQKFGHVSTIRSYESFSSGYPHVQVLLYFHEKEFNVFRQGGKFRVQEKEDLVCGYPSFVDAQAMHSWKGAVRYVGKYILKQLSEEVVDDPGDVNKQILTLALCWIFRKRSFSMSRDFVDLIRQLHISKSQEVQLDLLGSEVKEEVTWIFLGVYTARDLGLPPLLQTQKVEPSRELFEKIDAFKRRGSNFG